jgi:diguanylate cyclase (GGDEF)-like protein
MERLPRRRSGDFGTPRPHEAGEAPVGWAFDHLCDVARLSLRAALAGVVLVDETGEGHRSVSPRRAIGLAAAEALRDAVLSTEDPVVLVDDVRADRRFDAPALRASGVRSLIAARFGGVGTGCGGVVFAAGPEPGVFDDGDRHLVTSLARCASFEVELRQTALRDDLTGFLTRSAFMGRMRTLLETFETKGHPSTICFLDIDHFKSVNDRFGHGAGDRVLAAVAEACRDGLRPQDLCGRLGGEEFAIAMPGLTLDGAIPRVEALRERIAALDFGLGKHLRITGSFGVCALSEGIASVSVWCKMADAALYGAKHAGRNRVTVFRDALGIPGDGPIPPDAFDPFDTLRIAN